VLTGLLDWIKLEYYIIKGIRQP